MPYNNISAVVSAPEKTAINDGLDAIPTNMTYAVNLTPEERTAMSSIEEKRLAFATKCMEYAAANATLVPGYVSLPEAVKDQNLYNDLRPIKAKAAQMHELIDDTQHAVGWEWYKFCLEFYAVVQRASQANVPGSTAIYNDLKDLFDEQGGPPLAPPPGP